TYSLLSFILFYFCGKISYNLNLVDFPNKRKIHSKPTAYTGGILLSVILLFGIRLFDFANENLNLIFSIGFLISIIGLIDDKYNLNTGGKLSLQIIPVFYLVVFEGLILTQIGDYNYFRLELGSFAIPFTSLCILLLINAFNYFDGMDGTLSFTSISVLAILYFLVSDQNFQLFLIALSVPISIFLCFNFSIFKLPKLFLGDSGSLLLGFIISFSLIYLANQNLIHPILLSWSIVIFVFEFLSINLIRLKRNKNLFMADKDHLHHILYIKTKSIFFTNFLISLANIILFFIGYFCFLFMGAMTSLILFIFLFLIFFILRDKYSTIKN
ncbi:undecaprenyl/decaprenyl-phosphate alpha-N-acetylglucosaminyl 1-phosphate transferase, partial [Candidatus Pelagibacter sp.]|nr:undecaprenyl/decaprenyl-phosphate alpha-N-acetylglucosaminyl 1-phosphate transferase [Candidatus Pelagibacter sp.]